MTYLILGKLRDGPFFFHFLGPPITFFGLRNLLKKTVFLKNSPSHNLPKIKYVISEAHEDLLQWNLSWAFTFIFLVHQEGGVELWVVVVMSEIAFFV